MATSLSLPKRRRVVTFCFVSSTSSSSRSARSEKFCKISVKSAAVLKWEEGEEGPISFHASVVEEEEVVVVVVVELVVLLLVVVVVVAVLSIELRRTGLSTLCKLLPEGPFCTWPYMRLTRSIPKEETFGFLPYNWMGLSAWEALVSQRDSGVCCCSCCSCCCGRELFLLSLLLFRREDGDPSRLRRRRSVQGANWDVWPLRESATNSNSTAGKRLARRGAHMVNDYERVACCLLVCCCCCCCCCCVRLWQGWRHWDGPKVGFATIGVSWRRGENESCCREKYQSISNQITIRRQEQKFFNGLRVEQFWQILYSQNVMGERIGGLNLENKKTLGTAKKLSKSGTTDKNSHFESFHQKSLLLSYKI